MTRDKKAGGAGSTGSKRQKKTRVADGDQVPAAPDGLSERMQQRHRYVTCGADVNVHTGTMTSAHAYMSLDVDNSWSFDHFARNFNVRLNHEKEDEIEFDVCGVDPAVMNSLRRILISEIPTVAIEHVFFLDNTSIIADEMFAHRLGLIPINLDPRKLEWRQADTPGTERNTVVFKLHIDCTRNADGTMTNDKVLAQHLEYLPGGSDIPEETQCAFAEDQREALGLAGGVAAVVPDILLAKMRPGQSIELEAHCVKGVGEEHAKWSPVATAWYRLEPEVALLKDVEGERAEELMELCRPREGDSQPPLFRLEGQQKKLAVVKTRGNEHHLEKLRRLTGQAEWEEVLQVRKLKERFIFTIQSTGQLPPDVLFEEAIDVLEAKCDKLLENLQ